MAFGKQSGQPASGRQVQQLSALIVAAGHGDFRDARGPLGLTQRQAGGKFTSEEADAFIAQLETEADVAEGGLAARVVAAKRPMEAADPRDAAQEKALRKVSSEVLAAELQRRGWIVMEP